MTSSENGIEIRLEATTVFLPRNFGERGGSLIVVGCRSGTVAGECPSPGDSFVRMGAVKGCRPLGDSEALGGWFLGEGVEAGKLPGADGKVSGGMIGCLELVLRKI